MSSAPNRGPMIQVSHVAKRYPGGYEALRDVTFAVDAGEIVFITGHSGAGKSTLLKLITAIERPTAGNVTVGVPERKGFSAISAVVKVRNRWSETRFCRSRW